MYRLFLFSFFLISACNEKPQKDFHFRMDAFNIPDGILIAVEDKSLPGSLDAFFVVQNANGSLEKSIKYDEYTLSPSCLMISTEEGNYIFGSEKDSVFMANEKDFEDGKKFGGLAMATNRIRPFMQYDSFLVKIKSEISKTQEQ